MFAHAMIVELLCHLQIFVALTSLEFEWEQNEFHMQFESLKMGDRDPFLILIFKIVIEIQFHCISHPGHQIFDIFC